MNVIVFWSSTGAWPCLVSRVLHSAISVWFFNLAVKLLLLLLFPLCYSDPFPYHTWFPPFWPIWIKMGVVPWWLVCLFFSCIYHLSLLCHTHLLQLLHNFFFFPCFVVVSHILLSLLFWVHIVLTFYSSTICLWSLVLLFSFVVHESCLWVLHSAGWPAGCSSSSFLSWVTFAFIVWRYKCQSSITTLFMLSCVLPFAQMYHFLAMYASLKNWWHFFHAFSVAVGFLSFVMVSTENQSHSKIWSTM